MEKDKGRQSHIMGIITPPRMPLGYIVEAYPAQAGVRFPTGNSPGVLENSTFIAGENLPSNAVELRRSENGASPIDLRSTSSRRHGSSESSCGGSLYGPRDLYTVTHAQSQDITNRLHDNVIMQCEEIPVDEEDASPGTPGQFQECIEVLSDRSSRGSEDVSTGSGEGFPDETGKILDDETLLPYQEVFTQRSVAYVISGYAYTRNREQMGKTYLRCRERGCGARAMIMTNVQRATVFNSSHNHPPPDLLRKIVKKRRLSDEPNVDSNTKRASLTSFAPPDAYPPMPVHFVAGVHPSGLKHVVSGTSAGGARPSSVVYVHSLPIISKMASTAKTRLTEFLDKMELDLDRVMNFWQKHSHDTVNGGFFVCLGRDGKRYDDLKYCWLQGRQVWVYCKLYNTLPKYRTPEILQAAKKGGDFLMNCVKNPTTGKCYFSVTKDGKAVKIQRTIFSECFYVLAMSELARATNDKKYKQEAIKMLDQLKHWVCVDDTGLGRPQLLGAPRVNSLSRAMIFLNLLDELTAGDPELQEKYASLEKWSIEQSLQHMQREGSVILETVSTEGKELSGSSGRLMNPGHAIETGWFLLQCGIKHDLAELKNLAVDHFITKPFQSGWDPEHGGLFSFLDADGLSPTQLEWNMKLWWPHCEALVAALMAYSETKEERFLDMFEKVFDYTFTHFVDAEHGEWFGYLNQEGKVTIDFKGGPFKGCFHVPRCLLMCIQLLQKILKGE